MRGNQRPYIVEGEETLHNSEKLTIQRNWQHKAQKTKKVPNSKSGCHISTKKMQWLKDHAITATTPAAKWFIFCVVFCQSSFVFYAILFRSLCCVYFLDIPRFDYPFGIFKLFWTFYFKKKGTDWLVDWFMVFNATFNNISAISWWSVLMVEETGVPGETTDLSLTNFITNCCIEYTSPWTGYEVFITYFRTRIFDQWRIPKRFSGTSCS
jgi:hypothetical protein